MILSVKDEGKKGLWLAENNKDYKKLTGLIGKNISYSKDKKFIVFEALENGNTDIFMIELKSYKLIRITQNESHDYMPSINPTGRFIVFSSGRSGNYFIYKKDLVTGEVIQLTGN